MDLGLVGEVTGVNTVYLNLLLDNGIMPVIAPIGVNDACEPHNINADVAASAIAAKLRAEKLVFLSDVEGVMADDLLVPSMDRPLAERRRLLEAAMADAVPPVHLTPVTTDAAVAALRAVLAER